MFTGIIEDLGTVASIRRSPDGAVLTIRTALPIARITIGESIAVSGVSMMPEGLLEGLSDQQVCDLFAYLRSGQPLNEPKK